MLKTFSHVDKQTEDFTISGIEEPPSWRLVKNTESEVKGEEATFCIQGVLCAYDLPPVSEKYIIKI